IIPVYPVKMSFQGRFFRRGEIDFLFLFVEAQYVCYQPVSLCSLCHQTFIQVIMKQMVVPCSLALPDKIGSGIGEKEKLMLRFYIFIRLFFKQHLYQFTGGSIILVHLHMILVTVQYANENIF